ncbi:MAG: DUF2309 domain-containing protein [Pirellulaceae bacterium]|nr:DUF2309 domain-containing protein [Pirellulaceae bacterium]
MSIANALPQHRTEIREPQRVAASPHLEHASDPSPIQGVLERVQARIAPVWPLRDYVAVNPYQGLADQKFLSARKSLQAVSDLELLMTVDYYRQQFAKGTFSEEDLEAAVEEMVAEGVAGAGGIVVSQVVAALREPSSPGPTADAPFAKANNQRRRLRIFAETLDHYTGSDWCRVIRDEVSKHCAAHYDQGQAMWASPWRDLSLYQAWRSAARYDLAGEILGIGGLRKLISGLPHQPHAALVVLLKQLGVPGEQWADFLVCEALAMPGWSAWTRYLQREAERRGGSCSDFAGLLAIRLAYQAALSVHLDFRVDWRSFAEHPAANDQQPAQLTDEDLLRYTLLKATEIAFRRRLVDTLKHNGRTLPRASASGSRLAQLVFCIDVRSERLRRHLEAASNDIETFGFAGFFGLPFEFVRLGEAEGSSQVPVLISPQFTVREEIDATDTTSDGAARKRRETFRFLRKSWKEFQASAVSTFAFVETVGIFYGFKLVARLAGRGQAWPGRFDGVRRNDQRRLGPSLRGLTQQGICTSRQADIAESILRGIGIVADFGRLVVFCGHSSQTENNPLKAGLDCGACGGHSGEANARLAARLLNQTYIRQALAQRGIDIPDDTLFVAALHNTTTDELTFFDTDEVSSSHGRDLQQLDSLAKSASGRTRQERLSALPGRCGGDLLRRSRDWSEVRPEWGLAGNAAFIAAPRELTRSLPLDGRAFLHSYDYRKDADFSVLEQIMTAPLVVAHWINMQYYASTVDPIHFSSRNKTVHNVVGRFGIFSGNGGDLTTGLPWQSIHDGREYQHHPLRLLAVIAAPREAIEAVIARHENVAQLVANGWLQLIAIEHGDYHRYAEPQRWERL